LYSNLRALVSIRRNDDLPVEFLHAFLQAEQAKATACSGGIGTHAVVFDVHDYTVLVRAQRNQDVLCFPVSCGISKGLLHNPVNASALNIAQIIERAVDTYSSRNAGVAGELPALPFKCGLDPEIIQH